MSQKGTDAAKQKIDGLMKTLGKQSFSKQLALGAATGWVTGFYTIKVGKVASCAVGTGILIYEIAKHNGVLGGDWNEIKMKCEQKKMEAEGIISKKLPQVMCQAKVIASRNRVFATGFVGGFLIGVAC